MIQAQSSTSPAQVKYQTTSKEKALEKKVELLEKELRTLKQGGHQTIKTAADEMAKIKMEKARADRERPKPKSNEEEMSQFFSDFQIVDKDELRL